MTVIITTDTNKASEQLRLFTRLRSKFFSLYEVEKEISEGNSNPKITITSDEYDYRQSLKDRQETLKSDINKLLKDK